MPSRDSEFMQIAIEEAKKSKAENTQIHPKVGVVVAKDNVEIARAHRGELGPGEHAEYTVLERKLKDEVIAGCTVFTTLEPCTTRNHPKVPCANRLLERKVKRVVIGMLDPNPLISGKGQMLLRNANIQTDMFDLVPMSQVEELNRDFIRTHSQSSTTRVVDESFIALHRNRDIDECFRTVNVIYWNRNFYRDAMAIYTHLVEVVGGLSLLASNKKKPGVIPEEFVYKSVAWWMALCGKVGVESVANMLWAKFPDACAYCQRNPHDPDVCSEKKSERLGPDWSTLESLGVSKKRPRSLGDWQRMFSSIYPAQQTEDYGPSFGRLSEELGELAETLRVFPAAPGYFLSEAADVFAWLMHIQNIVDQKKGTPKLQRGDSIERGFCTAYPDKCLDCGATVCRCPAILQSTIGRIAHEVPHRKSGLAPRFLSPEETVARYQITDVRPPNVSR
jgi:pyrimidine deaminase RibD-like protein